MTKGMYGAFGGQYAPETLMIALEELENAYEQVKDDADFQQELQFYLREYANRPSLLYYARKMSEELGGAKIYLKREDLNHTGAHKINVFKMELLGATVTGVSSGTGTLKDACNEAMRAWASRCDDTFYVLGSAVGPHPYPMIVRDFQKIISEEMKAQCLEKEGRLPDAVIA